MKFHVFIEQQFAFEGVYLEVATETNVLEGFRHARAHVARMVLFARDSWNGYVRHARANGPRGLLGQEC